MLETILPQSVYNCLLAQTSVSDIQEIRMRIGQPVSYAIRGIYYTLDPEYHAGVTRQELDHVIAVATHNSLYACTSMLAQGYLPCQGGLRVGVCGEGVTQDGEMSALRTISSVCIRVPHAVTRLPREMDAILQSSGSILIVSPPGMGKTTLLRECMRRLADGTRQVLAIDERGELSGSAYGTPAFDVGISTDLCVGVAKEKVYRYMVRSMRPDVIVTDELFGAQEISAVADCVRCGIRVIATVHGTDYESLRHNEVYGKLLDMFRYIVVLRSVGQIALIRDQTVCGY